MSELLLAVTEDNELVPSVAGDVPSVGVSVQISLLALAQVADLHVAVIVEQGGQSGVCTEARLRSHSDQSQGRSFKPLSWSEQSRYLPAYHHHHLPKYTLFSLCLQRLGLD